MDTTLRKKGIIPTDENRMGEMWFNMVKDCMEGLQQAKKDAANRLLLINYDNLIKNPILELTKIEDFLNLPPWKYNLDNITSETTDDDLSAWGMNGMHQIRPKLEKTARHPGEILGQDLYNRFISLEKQYLN
jgi:hypothetical protein